MDNMKLFKIGVVLALLVGVFNLFHHSVSNGVPSGVGGAAGNMLLEDYLPYTKYNGGTNTALPINATGGIITSGTASTLGATSITLLTTNGSVNSTTTVGAETLAAADMTPYSAFVSTSTYLNAAFTITLPASSTLSSFIPTAGSYTNILFCNATTTAGVKITLAGNTGTIVRSATTTSALIYPGTCSNMHFFRSATTTGTGDIYATQTWN